MKTLNKWLDRLGRTSGTTPRRRPGRRRFGFEGLESRELLATLYVAASGSDGGTGAVDSPLRNIQKAITAAQSGDEIRVAAGSYFYDSNAEVIDAKRSITYTSVLKTTAVVSTYSKQLSILGGFSTTNWVVPDPVANPTIIDGQGRYRGVIVVGFDSPTGLRLEGFTIQNGLATGIAARGGADAAYGFGGGLFADMGGQQSSTSPYVFRDLVFRNNTARASSPIGGEGGRAAGGGMALRFVRDATMQRVSFEGNVAQAGDGGVVGGSALGGALHMDHSVLVGSDLTFAGNFARSGNSSGAGRNPANGLKADALGGAVAVQAGSLARLTRLVAANNEARGGEAASEGGDAYGGAFFAEFADATLNLSDAVIRGNRAIAGNAATGGGAGGGGIMTQDSGLILERAVVAGNSVSTGSTTNGGAAGGGGGGGIYLARFGGGASHAITSTVVAQNSLTIGQGSVGGGGGGGVWLQGVDASLTHVTLDRNTIDPRLLQGQAVLLVGGGVATTTARISNSIVSNHDGARPEGGAVDIATGAAGSVAFNRVLDFKNRTLVGSSTPAGVSGLNTVLRPDASSSPPDLYNAPGAPRFDYHLNRNVSNPAIDQSVGSTTALDLDGNPRSGAADLGAAEAIAPRFEFAGAISTSEGRNARIVIARRGDLSAAGSVVLAVAGGGSATPGVDFTPLGTNGAVLVEFAPYEETKTVELPTAENSATNAPLTVNLVLGLSPANDPANRLGGQSTATVAILDNDGLPISTPSGFVAADVQVIRTGRGIVGASVRFSAALSPTVVRRGLLKAFGLRKVSGRGRAPALRSARYNRGSSTVTLRFGGPLRAGVVAQLILRAQRLKDASNRPLGGATTFTIA